MGERGLVTSPFQYRGRVPYEVLHTCRPHASRGIDIILVCVDNESQNLSIILPVEIQYNPWEADHFDDVTEEDIGYVDFFH